MFFQWMRITLWLLLALSQVSCLNLGSTSVPVIKEYQLQAPAIAPLAMPKTSTTLVVKEGFIAPMNRSLAIAYQIKAYQIHYFVESRWQTLPSSMITVALAETLQNSGLFKAVVVAPPFVGPIDQTVTVNLLGLVQIFDVTQQHACLDMHLQVVLSNGVTGKIDAIKDFTARVPADPTPVGGVVAANRALQQLLPEIMTFIVKAHG